MPIRVKTPDGYANFPDGTPDAEIERVLAETYKPQRQIGMGEAGVRGAIQGATLGFSDELAGYIPGQPFGTTEEIRAANELASKQNPGTYLAGEIAGGVAPFLGPVGGVAGAGGRIAGKVLGKYAPEIVQTAANAPRYVKSAGQGAGIGGGYGAGTSEGGLENRLAGGGKGAIAGATLGAVAPKAADVIGAGWRGLKNSLRVGSAKSRGERKLAEALVRDKIPQGEASDKELAGVINALVRKLNDINAVKTDPSGRGLAMIADLGGENTRNLMRAAANVPSSGVQKIRGKLDFRAAHQNERIARDIGKALGDPAKFQGTTEGLIEARKVQAKPLFDAAFAKDTPLTPQLSEVLNRPAVQDALTRAVQRAQNEGGTQGGWSTTRLLHITKMEIDKLIGAAKRAEKMGNNNLASVDARTWTKAKQDLLGAIDNPDYKAALNKYSGDSALVGSIDEGFENGLKLSTDQLAAKMAKFNDSERELFQLGVAKAMADKLARLPRTRDRTNFFASPDMQKRLEVLLPDLPARRGLQRSLLYEARFPQLRKAIEGGSPTAKQQVQAQEAGKELASVDAAAIGQDIITGHPLGIAMTLARGAKNKFTGFTPPVAREVLEAGMGSGQNLSPSLMEALSKAAQAPARRSEIVRALVPGLAEGAAGGLSSTSPLTGSTAIPGPEEPGYEEWLRAQARARGY